MPQSKAIQRKSTGRSKVPHVPDALAKNAQKSAASKQQRLVSEGRADVALIHARKERISEDFFDIGEALVRLKRPGIAEALGYSGFVELCERELDMAPQKAAQLISIVKAIPREQARALGQERASALITLAEATPEDDTALSLATTTLTLPGGKTLDLSKASTREIRDAAKAVRQASTPTGNSPARGATTTLAERNLAADLQRALHGHGAEEARVTAVARPGRGALVRIERVPLASLHALANAISEATRIAPKQKPAAAHAPKKKPAAPPATKKKPTKR